MPLIGDLHRQISPEEIDQNRRCYLRSGRVIVFETVPREVKVYRKRVDTFEFIPVRTNRPKCQFPVETDVC